MVNLSPAVADQLGLDPFAGSHGVMVTKVAGGLAANIGLRPGDLMRAGERPRAHHRRRR